jgi:hypothetical protein
MAKLKRPQRARKSPRLGKLTPFSGAAKIKTYTGRIVKEIMDEMNLTAASVGKTFEPNAFQEWKPKLTHAVWVKLAMGGNWETDRPNVLAVAHDMILIASIISAGLPKIAKNKIHGAFRAVKEHDTCPVIPGSGQWCNFDI